MKNWMNGRQFGLFFNLECMVLISNTRLKAVIRLYNEHQEIYPEKMYLAIKKARSNKEAIEIACKSKNLEGKRDGHQYRISQKTLEEWSDAVLMKMKQVKKIETFDKLHEILKSVSKTIYGVGELLTYDSADRIGVKLNLGPQKIYLHAGTKEGAKSLLGKLHGQILEKGQLPKPLRDLECRQIENFLCICKALLNGALSDKEFHQACLAFEEKYIKEKRGC